MVDVFSCFLLCFWLPRPFVIDIENFIFIPPFNVRQDRIISLAERMTFDTNVSKVRLRLLLTKVKQNLIVILSFFLLF